MESIKPSKVKLNIESLSNKQKNVILSIIKDVGFIPAEISDLIIEISACEESSDTERGSL